jgi:hypothetical protein
VLLDKHIATIISAWHGSCIWSEQIRGKTMKIIRFPSIQRNENPSVSNHPTAPLLFQYRHGAHGELLVWAIWVFCAIASIVLSVSQLQNDVSRVQRTHLDRISASQLADETPCAAEVSKQL